MTYEIPMNEVTKEFAECWRSAGLHLNEMASALEERQFGYFNASLAPPFLEHLSFRVGNKIYFVCLADIDQSLTCPTGVDQTIYAAELARGVPCVLPMRKTREGWKPVNESWGLVHAQTSELIDPAKLITDEPVAMSEWEIQDFAVQIVRSDLEAKGHQILSNNSHPNVNPSLFFVNEHHEKCFVQVLPGVFPNNPLVNRANLERLKRSLDEHSDRGFYAPVKLLGEEVLNTRGEAIQELFRGFPLSVSYDGLIEIT